MSTLEPNAIISCTYKDGRYVDQNGNEIRSQHYCAVCGPYDVPWNFGGMFYGFAINQQPICDKCHKEFWDWLLEAFKRYKAAVNG